MLDELSGPKEGERRGGGIHERASGSRANQKVSRIPDTCCAPLHRGPLAPRTDESRGCMGRKCYGSPSSVCAGGARCWT